MKNVIPCENLHFRNVNVNKIEYIRKHNLEIELNQRIMQLEEELQYNKGCLQTSNEEHLVYNEELLATNEEVQAINDELLKINIQY